MAANLLILFFILFFTPGLLKAQKNDLTKRRPDHAGSEREAACRLKMGRPFKIDISRDGKERQFPFVYKFGKNIFVSFSEHRDAVIASPADAMMISRDNGKTWPEKQTRRDFYMTSMVEKNDTLFGIVYFTYPVSSTEEKMIYWTSVDEGRNWSKHEGIVHTPEGKKFRINGTWGSMLFHRGMQVMDDGSVQGTMYGRFEGDQKYRVLWVKSTDNCADWSVVSTIAQGVPEGSFKKAEGYCEPAVARVGDGSLLCIMRVGSYLPLYQSRSADNGLTWSRPIPVPGLSAVASQSVDPQLLLMKNGILALTYGRPGDRIAFSYDGSGYRWNCSSVTRATETTGYTGIVEIRRGELLLVADQGRSGAKEPAVWGRTIKVKWVAGN